MTGSQGMEPTTNLSMFIALRNIMPVHIWFCDYLRTSLNLYSKPFLRYPGESLGFSPLLCCELDSFRLSLHLALADHLHVNSQISLSCGPKEGSSLISYVD